ncbi:MAG: cellulase family glycosylhydrolase, partial [Anaerolineae bacterium]|nr:cellulase family glycosylhydrolase [Anaerolineae bacterium]
QQPWLVGCNFIPSTAINQLEMWQADTFDPATIDRELGWAADLGMNTVRVYLHDLAWQTDPAGFMARLDQFLAIAAGRGIRPLLTIFDDCWNDDPQPGPQPAPKPGVHNSGWVRSPGSVVVRDPSRWRRLEAYVGAVVGALADDERVLMWDLYNEPGNSGMGADSLPLLKAACDWARAADPSQPLTVGWWRADLAELNALQLAASDVISFHHYQSPQSLVALIAALRTHGRPLVCTEYMARRNGCTFATHLPIFRRERIGCYNWGLVAGKTNTIYAWDEPHPEGEPPLWFHDIYRADGTPYRRDEVALIRELTGAG